MVRASVVFSAVLATVPFVCPPVAAILEEDVVSSLLTAVLAVVVAVTELSLFALSG
jgi:hypothetical protein